jgi:hypothetical protein
MLVDLSGTRDGRPWPRRGSVVDLPDSEAAEYCAAGMAMPVVSEPDVETAVPPTDDVELRGLTTANGPSKRSRK